MSSIVNWPESLVLDIARRRCVIMLGSGVSRQAANASGQRPKMWGEFLDTAASGLSTSPSNRKILTNMLKTGDYLTACEIIRREMGTDQFNDLIVSEYLVPQFAAAPIHDSIIELDSRITATPNFDKIYESRINHIQNSSVAVKPFSDNDIANSIRGTQRVIIKIHGSVDRPSQLIFTRAEYAKARNEYRSFYTILQALIVTHTFLFLGCGLEDPDIKLLLEDYAFHHGFGRPHYFLLPAGQVKPYAKPSIEGSLNIKILEYNPQNNYKLFKDAIDELVLLVNAKRAILGTTLQW